MSAATSAYGSGKWTATASPPWARARVSPVAHQPSSGSPIRASGGPALAIGRTGSEAPSSPMWPSTFWRFSLPMTTRCSPSVSATTLAGRSAEARMVIAPLGREQVHDRHALGAGLEQCRCRRDEMDVAIDRRPAVGVDRLERDDQRCSGHHRPRSSGGRVGGRTRGRPPSRRGRPAARSGTGPGRTRRSSPPRTTSAPESSLRPGFTSSRCPRGGR